MAVSLSNHSLLPARPSASFSSSILSKPPTLLPVLCKPILGISLSLPNSSSPLIPNKSHNRPAFAARASARQANEEEDGSKTVRGEASHRNLPILKTIIGSYKEALLNGDDKTVSDIEDIICTVENEKNEFKQKVLALSSEINSGKEKFIRLQADFDNFRKRTEKERLTIRSDAQREVIESLLAMVDSFEKAKQQIKLGTEKEKKIDTSYRGIYRQFVEVLRSFRVSVVPTIGKPFDPSVHEAIGREASEEFKEGIVIQEFQRGFLLRDQLLRPARVKVSSGAGRRKDPVATEKLTGEHATSA
ncbi:hypothetical protein SLE2022_031810 [Rubroshorea leprosula]